MTIDDFLKKHFDYEMMIAERLGGAYQELVDEPTRDLKAVIKLATAEEQKEKKTLIKWLTNLTRKIMRYDYFSGLRGYPITHFQEKYLNK